jgi:serine protease
MIWAAGRPVPGVPNNSNPAHVINMSLGGPGSCFPAMQSFIDEALATGAIVVVAAGNENQNAADVSPASCSGVITVGATGFAGTRAPYSNYGSRIDVMAPGGDMSVDLNGDGFADGVLSLMYFDAEGEMGYQFQQGTSMAAPHVAGVISLMKAVKPDLTAQEALSVLRATARPLSAGQCNRPSGSECGAGLIDAFAALQALQGGVTPPPPGQVVFTPNLLDFGSTETEVGYTISNPGESTVTWTLLGFDEAVDNPAPLPDGALYLPTGAPDSGSLTPGASVTTALGIDREAITVAGFYRLELVFDISGQEQSLEVRFTIAASTPPSLTGPMIVAAFIEDEEGELLLSGFQESAGAISDYSFEVLAGDNIVIAWSDENDNGEIDQGDYLGVYPELVPVAAGQSVSGIDFQIDQIVSTTAIGVSERARRELERAYQGSMP